ncbi:Holo-[acyl-carrier-protein] synthase [Candida viswanathii]|uniref:Holo-[acyl-carrier-protein] synthase n=1 Tax=Candida viswanathii TaxID=5486 RepID=A0A367YBQ6_9ASCO|nr:Holo-[acyl-carrier-protein] synthase [Candida viswanathii]
MSKLGITLGLGVDLIKSSRFERLLTAKTTSFSQRLSKRILHPTHELPRFDSMTPQRQVQFLTGSWAAKEAVFKTLDIADQEKFNFNEWYRYHDSKGKPFIWNDGYAAPDEEFHLSISHDDSLVIATVLRQRIIDHL